MKNFETLKKEHANTMSMQDIIQANRNAGQHFFDENTMRFFNSKTHSVIRGKYFVTSEQKDHTDPRLYTARVCQSGKILDVSKFQQFKTEADAIDHIKNLPLYIAEALECASEEFNGRLDKGEFIKHASIEPHNRKDKGFEMDTFCGACTFLLRNYDKVDASFVKYYAEQVKAKERKYNRVKAKALKQIKKFGY